jgi:photolyase PhrII
LHPTEVAVEDDPRARPMDPTRDLPGHLAERVTARNDHPTRPGRDFVLYWMRTALRGHENPALDVAVALGERLGLPALVYQGISERYPFASDRHHAFLLEGAADLSAELLERGIAHACHVERPGQRGPFLRELAARAAVIVTEDMPVPPLTVWTRALAARVDAALWTVDTACVVPMPLVPRRPDRAFAFRDATRRTRALRLGASWRDVEPTTPAPALDALRLPFTPIDPRRVDRAALIGACAIDHTVAPVADTRGGSVAGYARWEAFRRRLGGYAASRNDPLRDGVSRMSAYLHYGMVSPLRIASEAAAIGGAGAGKYLDELLVWRELAYSWCWHLERAGDDLHALDVLPAWARDTLAAHAEDPRPQLPSWETLARGRTGDALWDAAQTSLLRHGELHNNLRMTWGKALLDWTPSAARAMDLLVDLNHRYALDGRDPSSYGGLWWCLGLFDRPFPPAAPRRGVVRPRPTEEHARRLDLARYRAQVERPIAAHLPRIAVVGAGIAGLTCARTLADHGLAVRVFDKGRGFGGRTSTRRVGAGLTFDHGAQYFTARDPRFQLRVGSWLHDGVVARWDARIATLAGGVVGPDPNPGARYVGTPGMSAITRHLGAELEVAFGVSVAGLARDGDLWCAFDDGGRELGRFDCVVLALPAPQAERLFVTAGADDLAAAAANARMAPSLAAMVAFATPLDAPFDGAFVSGSPLSWVARDSSKPGRQAGCDAWVLHPSPGWSSAHFDAPPSQWRDALLAAFAVALDRPLPEIVHADQHRWGFALPTEPLAASSLHDATLGLAACGDWCGGPRVEGAWLSGADLAGRILRRAVAAG